MRFELEHRLPGHVDKRSLLRQLYTDPRLNDALASMRHLKSREITHLAVDEAAGTAERVVRIDLDMPVPGALKRLFAGGSNINHLGWEEHSTCDFEALTIDFAIRLPHLDMRIDAGGRYQLRDGRADDEVLRSIGGHVCVDAPVVGGLAERIVVARLKDNMDEEARLTAEFLREAAN